jgi:outer membrane protein OmpA-like peptidoglycan-associated protein
MKISIKLVVSTIVFLFIVSNQTVEAQFLKKLKKKVERKVENKVDREIDKEIDKTLDGDKKVDKKTDEKSEETKKTEDKKEVEIDNKVEEIEEESNISDNLERFSKFDYVPGDKLLFFDDFSQDFIGDFPSRWNTNGSGEIVTFNNSPEKWFDLKQGHGVYFIPDLNELPENYTIEFDVLASGIDNKTSSSSRLVVTLEDNSTFRRGNNSATVRIPFCQYVAPSINLRNKINNQNTINSSIKADIRKEVLNKPHISIAVNKQRFRVWVNEKKYVDVPRMIGEGSPMKGIKFSLSSFKEGKEHVFIKNLKVAEGGVDLRRKLMNEGKISTNGILFDSGSDKIQPQSYGIIRQISQVLKQDANINLNIIGHTDADGNDVANLELSKKRAAAVKAALINIYKISGDRLETDGKGESIPIGDNSTTGGKAQNRRVEFVKI